MCIMPDPASNKKRFERGPVSRVPGHLPAHEVAIPGTLFVRALADRGVGDVAGMQEGQFADLRVYQVQPSHCSGAGGPRAT